MRIKGWPTCAVCQKPVEKLTQSLDVFRSGLSLDIACHGQVENIFVSGELMAAATEISVDGVAFGGESQKLISTS